MPTYTLINSQVLASSATSVTFSSIPSTYTDLVIRSSVRHNGTGGNVWFMGAQFNSVTTSVYSDTFLVSDMTSVIGTNSTNGTPFDAHVGSMVQNNYTANVFSNTEMYIPSYAGSTNKVWSAVFAGENDSANYNYLGNGAGLARTTEAITQILLKPNGSVGGFAAGSSFYLYGISNA
jgi:hypothetical protein